MPAPELDARVVETVLGVELSTASGARLVLLHGRYPATEKVALTVDDRHVHVTDQQSVLGILDTWLTHRERPGDDLLVVVHPLDDDQLGWDIRGHALGRRTLTVDRATIVARRFGATELDQRIRDRPWLIEGLLDAEPTGGWRRGGPVLTLDVAVRALVAARLGAELPDAGALLEWSQGHGPARFRALPADERDGITAWLTDNVGGVAAVLMALAVDGRAQDAIAIGVVAAVLGEPEVSSEVSLAVGGLLGTARASRAERRAFLDAVDGLVERWVAAAEAGGADGDQVRRRTVALLERADTLAAVAGLTEALADSQFLPSAFQARLRAVAAALTGEPDAILVASASAALTALREHRLARLNPERCAAASMAVRLLRWLETPAPAITSVGGGVTTQVRDGGWVDRALTAVWAGEAADDPVVGRAYQAVFDAARRRRDAQDEAFAALLASWSSHASSAAPSGTLLVEQVLDEIAAPLLTADNAPLIILVDGMSAAVAAELGEQLGEHGWVEISRESDRRAAAVATIPSVTRASRASLLRGSAGAGEPADERKGFASFWRRHRRGALLAHKADIAGPAGRRLAEPLVEALADGNTVVGVVLNTVDDALDHGREGDRTGWRLGDITYLPDLFDAARSYGRPVVLVADHGHVLDRGGPDGPTTAEGVESGRWRVGEPGAGEVALAGPRVLMGDGRVVVPWREDIRYTRRRAGYHGGAALAEMAVPVLVLSPSADQLPMGWSVLAPESVEPSWWNGRRAASVPVAPPRPARKPSRRPPAGEALFDMPEPVLATPSLGEKVVASEVYKAQLVFVRRAPTKPAVAAAIDALAVDGRLSAAATAAALGRAGRDPYGLVETLKRLLNVERYEVLAISGSTVELNVELLKLQFQVEP